MPFFGTEDLPFFMNFSCEGKNKKENKSLVHPNGMGIMESKLFFDQTEKKKKPF